MVNIPRGTTGQADEVASADGFVTGCEPYPGSVSNHWSIFQGGTLVAYQFSPGAWGFDSGTVTVPVSAMEGEYVAIRYLDYSEYQCPDSGVDFGSKFKQVYEFEVLGDIVDPPGPGDPPC